MFDIANPERLAFSRALDDLEDKLIGCGCDGCSNSYACNQYDEVLFGHYGAKVPKTAITMIGKVRLHQLRQAVETVLRENIPGDLIETGVWRGGACVMMRAVLSAHKIIDRKVYVADSFCGLPIPNSQYPADCNSPLHTYSGLSISLEDVKRNFNLPDSQVEFVQGWFKDTLPKLNTTFAVARLDGDMYESTWDALTSLYDKVVPGGFIIVDDWGGVDACRYAVLDFVTSRKLRPAFAEVNWATIYWRKEV